MTRPPLIVMIPLLLACLAAVHMVATVILDVVLRHGFFTARVADDEIIARDFAWAVMLACGAAIVWRHGPTAAALSGSLPRPWQRNVACLVAALSASCFAALAIIALRRLLDSIAIEAATPAGLPVWSFQLAEVVGFALAALLLIGVAIARFRPMPASDRDGAA